MHLRRLEWNVVTSWVVATPLWSRLITSGCSSRSESDCHNICCTGQCLSSFVSCKSFSPHLRPVFFLLTDNKTRLCGCKETAGRSVLFSNFSGRSVINKSMVFRQEVRPDGCRKLLFQCGVGCVKMERDC